MIKVSEFRQNFKVNKENDDDKEAKGKCDQDDFDEFCHRVEAARMGCLQ